ncbi:MAG TPA: hypothetical protein VGJ06_01755 [Candidatus Acidoferrum sp.]|jgi:hypothetical protein
MRFDDFNSQWHFVPVQPEAFRAFRRGNRVMFAILAVLVVGVFIAMIAPRPVHNAVTATKFGSAAVHKVKVLAPQHAATPGAQSR